jgi:hypothetical protein
MSVLRSGRLPLSGPLAGSYYVTSGRDSYMSLGFVIQLITRWELLLISGIMMILVPLISIIASVRPRPRQRSFVPPADRALMESSPGPVES